MPVYVILMTNTAADSDSKAATMTTFSHFSDYLILVILSQNTIVDISTLKTRTGRNIAMKYCTVMTRNCRSVIY